MTRVRLSPRPVRAFTRRVARSPFVADVRAHLPIIPEVIGAVAVAYVGMLVLRGLVVAAEIVGVR